MILHFRAYSKTNHDIEEVLRHGYLKSHDVNDPILVFGDNVYMSELLLNVVYREIEPHINRIIEIKKGSFVVEVNDMIGKTIKEKYGFKE